MNPRLLSTVQVRLVSTTSSSGSFPFPSHPRPTAHQIFHLPLNASRQEIKARYYDLVRVHHPDSLHCRVLPHSERHARFQAITTAYEVLLQSSASGHRPNAWGSPPWRPSTFYQRSRASYRDEHTFTHPYSAGWSHRADERWKDWLIVIAGLLSLAVSLSPGLFIFPSALDARHRKASANLAKARKDAKRYGEERRKDVRRRVAARKMRDQRLGEENPYET